MEQKKGWRPLPPSLKVMVIVLIFGLVLSLLSLSIIQQVGVILLGFHIYGYAALIWTILIGIVSVILLSAIWNRYNWAWKLGVGYFGIFSILPLLSLPYNIQFLKSQVPPSISSATQTSMLAGGIGGILLGVAINIIFLIIIYRKKKYFKY